MSSQLLMTGGIVVLLLKVTLVLTLSLLWARSLARASASTRHLLWLTSLSLLLLVPLVSSVAPALRVLPVPTDPTELAQGVGTLPVAERAAVDGETPADAAAAGADAREAAPTVRAAAPAPGFAFDAEMAVAALLAVWGLGSLFLLGRLAVSEVLLRRALRRTTPLEDAEWMNPLCEAADRLDLADLPRLVLSDDAAMPFACGFRRPTIVLPRVAETWGQDRRSAVLFHELAHVRRRDLLGHTVARLVCALYWVHPMVWAAARRLRAESERACDDLALSVGIRPSEYADHILQIVTAMRGPHSPAVAVPFADRRELEGRVLAILDPVLHRGRPSGANVGALAVLLLCGIAFSALAPVADKDAGGASMPAAHSSFMAQAPASSEKPAHPEDPAHPEAEEHFAHIPEVEVETPDASIHVEAHDGDLTVDVKNAANPALVAMRQSGDVSMLTNALANDPSPVVRKTAAWSLERFDDGTAAAALTRALLGDADEEVREMAAWALASDRGDRGTDAFVRALTQDESADVRATAAWALGGIGRPTAAILTALVNALDDASADVREHAAWGIGTIEPEIAPPALYRDALADADEDVRHSAAWALSEIRDPRATDALVARLDAESDEDVAHFVARALLFTSPRPPEALNRMLRSANPQLRAWAIVAAAGGSPPIWPAPQPRPRPRPYP